MKTLHTKMFMTAMLQSTSTSFPGAVELDKKKMREVSWRTMESLFKFVRFRFTAIGEESSHVISLTIFKQPSQYDGNTIRKNKVNEAIWGCEVNSTPACQPGCRENEDCREIQQRGDEER